jgi:hypothetical protein
MTRGEIEAFIREAIMPPMIDEESAVRKIADRWEEDVTDAREGGIYDGYDSHASLGFFD